MLNDTRPEPRVARVIGQIGADHYALMITDVQRDGRSGDYVVSVELPAPRFTREDAELLKRLADAVRTEGVTEKMEWLDEELRAGDGARLATIVDRIEALLPPE